MKHCNANYNIVNNLTLMFLRNLFILCITLGLVSSCTKSSKTTVEPEIKPVVHVYDSVLKSNLTLKPNIGLVYYKEKPFSGISTAYYSNGTLAETISYHQGKKEGSYKKWFANGLLSFQSPYTNGKQHGTTYSWWSNGNLRSESNHNMGVVHGKQLQWYKSGARFKEFTIVNGREEGMQRAWRENGKIYNNYEAKNGRIFGLKRASLCFKLEDEIVQYGKS